MTAPSRRPTVDAELAALADGSLRADRREALECEVAASPELAGRLYEVQRAVCRGVFSGMGCGESKARELARRQSGAEEIRLVWYPACGQVEVFVRDVATEVGFHLQVAAVRALDAFHHPYAYAGRRARVVLRA